jgi:hypothetical protein
MDDQQLIITHSDLDGIMSAAFLLYAFDYDDVKFTGPSSIEQGRIIITENDSVCDLPYPVICDMWFDHHPGNLEMVIQRGIKPEDISGRFAAKESCAEVVRDYLIEVEDITPLDWWDASLINVNQIDAFKYKSVKEWREVNPERIISDALKATLSTQKEHEALMNYIVYALVENNPLQVSKLPNVRAAYDIFRADEQKQFEFIMENISFHPSDSKHDWMILDLTFLKKVPRVNRQVAFMVHPDAKAVIVLTRVVHNGIPTHDINVSMSHGFYDSEKLPDFGDMLRSLNIGSGHRGAASGKIACDNPKDMFKKRDEFLAKTITCWQEYISKQ